MLRVKRSRLIIIGLFICFLVLIFERSPVIANTKALDSTVVSEARYSVKEIIDQLTSRQKFVSVKFSRDQLDAASTVASSMAPSLTVNASFNLTNVIIAASVNVMNSPSLHINMMCKFDLEAGESNLSVCYLGDLPLPGIFVKWLMYGVAIGLFNQDVAETLLFALSAMSVNDEILALEFEKSSHFKEDVLASVDNVTSVAKIVNQTLLVDKNRVDDYLKTLEFHQNESQDLAYFIYVAMTKASVDSVERSSIKENTAALWALSIKFANPQFARLIGLELADDFHVPRVELRGRYDHTLHFLYSAILEQIGKQAIGFSIGELKELLDAGQGGSGYSFPDIVADRAGLQFSRRIRESDTVADRVQSILSKKPNTSLFYPFAHDYPEGITQSTFQRVFKDTNNPTYIGVIDDIDRRISSLPIMREQTNDTLNQTARDSTYSDKPEWLTIDTHNHTQFSDGNFTVDQIASEATKNGCDVIAITDHGDYQLKEVLSEQYFLDIYAANKKYQHLTIIPGFEWNLPPFAGREHATVLFPDTANLQRDLSSFRRQFDHFERLTENVISIHDAFEWLNAYQKEQKVSPVVFYNHPSRKDFFVDENQHDLAYWRDLSDIVIGFSGSPGHQRLRSNINGSYEQIIKTQNGWDPAVAIIGGPWDKLMQKGYRVFGARAASDFHNLNLDYWPCEFSSTHVKARSASHNDVLIGLREGEFWAQHGKFIESLSFTASAEMEPPIQMGQSVDLRQNADISVNIEINLNPRDWQNNTTSLDQLELIVLSENSVDVVNIPVHQYIDGNTIKYNATYALNSRLKVFRLRGRSIQPGQHDYMFYTNPIFIASR